MKKILKFEEINVDPIEPIWEDTEGNKYVQFVTRFEDTPEETCKFQLSRCEASKLAATVLKTVVKIWDQLSEEKEQE